jgi:hypothetical protein
MGRNFTPEVLQALDAPYRNALAPRGGLAFDGTTNTRVSATLTGQSIGTSDFSLSAIFRVPAANPATGCGLFGLFPQNDGNGANLFYTRLNASGTLTIQGATSGYWECALPSFISTYGGKTIHLALVRTGTALAIYINGVSQAHTDGGTDPVGSWAIPITSTYLVVGQCAAASTSAPTVSVYSASLYNLALSAADVLEIYEGGGAVPERFKFGTQTNRYPTGNVLSLGATDANVATSGNANGATWAITAGTRTGGAGSYYHKITGAGWLTWFHWSLYLASTSSTYMVRFWARLNAGTSGNGLCVGLGPQGGSILAVSARQAVTSTWTQYTHVLTIPNAKTVTLGMLSFDSQLGGPLELDIDDVEIVPIGAVVHLDGDSDGIGYQWHDQSTNKLDAVLTATGVSWAKPARRGYVRGTLTWAGTHELKSLLGQRCIPNEARWDAISAKATVGSSGSGIRFADASDTYSIATVSAFTTAKKPITIIAANVFPGGTSDNNCNLSCDPDTANFTGSIAIEAQYSVTEGTP